ncbi:hypothetical protein D3C76_1577020 [compost metagenome]
MDYRHTRLMESGPDAGPEAGQILRMDEIGLQLRNQLRHRPDLNRIVEIDKPPANLLHSGFALTCSNPV